MSDKSPEQEETKAPEAARAKEQPPKAFEGRRQGPPHICIFTWHNA